MKVSEHRRFLDAYAGLTSEVDEFTVLYNELVEKREIMSRMNTSDANRKREIEMLEFAVEEIQSSQLKKNEDEELEYEEARLSQYEKLSEDVENLSSMLSSPESSVVSMLKTPLCFRSRGKLG